MFNASDWPVHARTDTNGGVSGFGTWIYAAAAEATWPMPLGNPVSRQSGPKRIEVASRGLGKVTLQAAGSDQFIVRGVLSAAFDLLAGDSATFVWDGTYWVPILVYRAPIP